MEKFTSKYKLNEEQLNQLKQIVPEAFRDNILDFNSLYEALSDFIENDEDSGLEQFGLTWPGKRQAKRAAAIPPVGTLVPVPGDGVDEDTTRNIYIEGDNLEVLKILRKAYTGRVKMIYIDPPYNTGNDFIYDDNFTESVESYQKRTGQVDENGVKMTTNNRSDGRFHSKWCSMIYPRLRLARELLSEDGVIFISIDDNEVAQLRKICDEIFGEGNFVAIFVWKKRTGSNDSTNAVSQDLDYILCFVKSNHATFNGEKKDFAKYDNPDKDPRGEWAKDNLTCNKTASERPNLFYPITDPKTGIIYQANPNRVWAYEKQRMERIISENKVIFPKNGKGTPTYKRHKSEIRSDFKPFSTLIETKINAVATKEVQEIFSSQVFSYPKAVDLLKQLTTQATISDSIILDFFSGSSTTAHAIMKLNAEDNGKRRFIMIQLPEICDKDGEAAKAGFKNICEIGKERIRRAGKKIKEEAGLNADNIDTGFKVFRLAPSNYKAWENYNGTDTKQLEELFKQDSLKPGWKEDDLLTEVILLEGFPLDSKVELLPQFNKNKVKKISSDFHDNTLYICLDKDIHNETIETLSLTDKERFICLDSAIDDQSKIRLEDKNLIKTL